MNSIPTECPQFNMPNIQEILKSVDLTIERKQNFIYKTKDQILPKEFLEIFTDASIDRELKPC